MEADVDAETAQRDAMLRAIGVDPTVIRWPDPVCTHEPEPMAAAPSGQALSDPEWDLIAPHLSAEPSQAHAMCNRAFLDAVLVAMARGAWTDPRHRGPSSDAVRRRFGRWAAQGVWQRLAAANLALAPARKAALLALAQRAGARRR
ncbi:transposase [Hyphomicrobium sp.]|uniref:transposase n=1 Tax=Hyphomicrobium sp. TaxID=82 RepID=UPI001DB4A1DF|nr:transposase [Hyphomicrobium sp.]MBY0558810.1 transposase [Hyphomicrobium sp.]